MRVKRISIGLAALGLAACAGVPVPGTPVLPATSLVIDRLPEDFPHGGDARTAGEIDLIVVHSIGGPTCRDGAIYFTPAGGDAVFWRDWFLGEGGKSIHYVIGREGDIAQQRPELRTAGHVSFGGIMTAVNRRSIGIELVNRGDGIEPFPEAQIAALNALVAEIAARYGLPPHALVTHAALDDRMQPDCGGLPLRRNLDPGPLFPLQDVRAAIRAR
ncbi:MAG: N-acetylmuramoyl-L-alanine amidase [Hyphomonas sp.]